MSTMSTPAEWRGFLEKFAAAIGAREWPGSPAAPEEELLAAEKRLKSNLPPSYRAFLSASNGWSQTSRAVPVLRPVERIRWFGREHAEWVRAYQEPMQGIDPPVLDEGYFNYSLEDLGFDVGQLGYTLCVSEVGDSAVLLLNPMVVWPDGEWETWFFADWLPGAARYYSFADWMSHELSELLDEPFEHTGSHGVLPTVYRDGPARTNRRTRKPEKLPALAVLLQNFKSSNERVRVKAAKQLARLGGMQAIDALLDTLRNDTAPDVRCEAAESLGKLRANQAVDALIAAIEDPGVNTTAIHALGRIDDEKGKQCLLKLVEEGGMYATSAAYPLSLCGDVRPIPRLIRFLTSKDPRDNHIGGIAGRMIAEYRNEAAYLALEPLAHHPDTETRSRALLGVEDLAFMAKEKSLKIKARDLLRDCLAAETDERLHQWLAGVLEFLEKKRPK
jgi:hypothetical protein